MPIRVREATHRVCSRSVLTSSGISLSARNPTLKNCQRLSQREFGNYSLASGREQGCLDCSLRQGFNAVGGVVARVVHQGTDRISHRFLGRRRAKERLESFGFLDARIKPQIILLVVQDHRHPVVKAANKVVRFSGQEHARVDGDSLGAFPMLPQPGERKRASILPADVGGLLLMDLSVADLG